MERSTAMIVLHVESERSDLDVDIERQLADLVVAHSVVTTDATVPVTLPAINDGDRWVGAEDLAQYITELRSDVALWRKFQTDACYVDDDGSIC